MIKNGDIKCIMGEGMPIYRDPFTKGRLIIKFTVKFPENGFLPPAKIPELEKILPPRQEIIVPDNAEEHQLEDFDENEQNYRRRGEAYDSDDEGGMGGQRVQCASH